VPADLAEWLAAFIAKDIEKLYSLSDAAGIYANFGAPVLPGSDKSRSSYARAFEIIADTLRYQEEAAIQDGNLALLLSIYYVDLPQKLLRPQTCH